MAKRSRTIVSAGLGVVLVVGATAGLSALHKEVTLSVDGKAAPVAGFALTVSDVLASRGIVLGERDLVYPDPSSPVSDGDTVTVLYSKAVTLSVDGVPISIHTTATTLDAALAEFEVSELAQARLSTSRSALLPREGLEVAVTTPKAIRLKVGGKQTMVTTTSATVAELLDEQGIAADAVDLLTPAADTALTEDLLVTLDKVKITTKKVTEPVSFTTQTKHDASLWQGESRTLTQGKDGLVDVVYQITTVNGKQTEKTERARRVLETPVDAVKLVGTRKAGSSGKGINLARADMWDRIAKCESGGNWKINTGNGYYGGLQFSNAAWVGGGGRDFAAYAHQASRAEQITVANRYYAKMGLKPWTCRRVA